MAATTMAILLGLTAAQTAYGVAGDLKNAKSARKQGDYEGGMYDRAAADAIARGDEAANQTAAAGRALTGAQRAALAAQGIDIESGSASDVISSDERLNALDVMTIHNNADREALGLKQQAKFARMGGRNAAAGYKNQIGSTLLGGSGQMVDIYRRYGLNGSKPSTAQLRDQHAM